MEKVIDLKKVVGKNYKEFWDFKGRYRVVKGGRGSKKSHTTALWFIYHLLEYENANALCVRQYYNSLKDSQFAELKKAAKRLGVYHLFEFKVSPLEISVKHTGQKILFRGFDNPDSITSIAVSHGYLCWVWIEEAYQVESEESFNKLDFSIRGIQDERLFPQLTLTLNPWSKMWIKDRFFDHNGDEDILAITRNYYHNEFLSKKDKKMFLDLKKTDANAYRIVGEGEWGIASGTYFHEFSEALHTVEPFDIRNKAEYKYYASFDYGLDMFACYFYAVDRFSRVYVYREIYEKNKIVSEAAKSIAEYTLEDGVEAVYAPPDMWNRQRESGKSIADIFISFGIPLIRAANNRVSGWLMVKEQLKPVYEDGKTTSKLIIFRNCVNLIDNIPKLRSDEKNPSDTSVTPHDITHAPDALRYFLASYFSTPDKPGRKMSQMDDFLFPRLGEEEEEMDNLEEIINNFLD